MEADKSLDPIAVGSLGPDTVMLHPQRIAHLLEQLFRLAAARRALYNQSHVGVFIASGR